MSLSNEMVEEITKVINIDREFKEMKPIAKATVKRKLDGFLKLQSENAVEYLKHTYATPSEYEPVDKTHRALIFCISLLVEQKVSEFPVVDVSGLIRALITMGYMLRIDEERGIIDVKSGKVQDTDQLQA